MRNKHTCTSRRCAFEWMRAKACFIQPSKHDFMTRKIIKSHTFDVQKPWKECEGHNIGDRPPVLEERDRSIAPAKNIFSGSRYRTPRVPSRCLHSSDQREYDQDVPSPSVHGAGVCDGVLIFFWEKTPTHRQNLIGHARLFMIEMRVSLINSSGLSDWLFVNSIEGGGGDTWEMCNQRKINFDVNGNNDLEFVSRILINLHG